MEKYGSLVLLQKQPPAKTNLALEDAEWLIILRLISFFVILIVCK